MFCQNCGVKINNESKFCGNCGKKRETFPSSKRTLGGFNFRNELFLWFFSSAFIIFVFYFLKSDNPKESLYASIFFGGIISLMITLIRDRISKNNLGVKDHKRNIPIKLSNQDKHADRNGSASKKSNSLLLASFGLAGLIYYFTHDLTKMPVGEYVVTVISLLAGIFYYKMNIKYHYKKNLEIWLFPVLLFFSIVVSVFFIGLVDNWEAVAVRTPFGSEVVNRDKASMEQLNKNLEIFLTDFQKRWEKEQLLTNDEANTKVGYLINITAYKNMRKLNEERYDEIVKYSDQLNPILAKYSLKSVDALSQLVEAGKKSKDASNDVLNAKVNYYRALLGDEPKDRISEKFSAINTAIDKLNQTEQAVIQTQKNWKNINDEFLGSR